MSWSLPTKNYTYWCFKWWFQKFQVWKSWMFLKQSYSFQPFTYHEIDRLGIFRCHRESDLDLGRWLININVESLWFPSPQFDSKHVSGLQIAHKPLNVLEHLHRLRNASPLGHLDVLVIDRWVQFLYCAWVLYEVCMRYQHYTYQL